MYAPSYKRSYFSRCYYSLQRFSTFNSIFFLAARSPNAPSCIPACTFTSSSSVVHVFVGIAVQNGAAAAAAQRAESNVNETQIRSPRARGAFAVNGEPLSPCIRAPRRSLLSNVGAAERARLPARF